MEKTMIELFCGSGKISRTFEKHGYTIFTTDIRQRKGVCEPHLRKNIMDLSPKDLPKNPFAVWAGVPCDVWSYAPGAFHWKNGKPNTEKCIEHIAILEKTMQLIDELRPAYFFIENPRARLRNYKPFKQWLLSKGAIAYTVTLSSYGFPTTKPTNIFTNFHGFVPRPLDPFGRGAKSGGNFKGMTTVQRQATPVELIEEMIAYLHGEKVAGTLF